MTRKVLVVDDDRDIRETIAEVLEEHGFTVCTATNGQDGLDKVRTARPDLVLLDLMMPVLDGAGFCTAIRSDPLLADLPIVVISAYHDVETLAREMQVSGVLAKPLELERLVAAVHRHSAV